MLVLHGVISLLREMYADKKAGELIALADKAAATIDSHITFMKEYQQIGMKAPRWQNTGDVFRYAARHLFLDRVTLDADAGGFEVYADPLLGHVFFNLIDNALRHGGGVSRIDLTHRETEKNLVISVQDNGCGVPDEDKQNIFECSFGKNTGLGLFLSREILSITGITIAETGVPGNSARFEITVPEGKYRPVPCAGRI
jgi:signal transduction histidine kinase